MADDLYASIRAGDLQDVREWLERGADPDRRDDQGWTPLCWAAGGGHAEIVRLLIVSGADADAPAADGRTPREIALAAGRLEAARALVGAHPSRARRGGRPDDDADEEQPYCRAYHLRELRGFAGWTEGGPAACDAPGGGPLPEDTIAFVHRDYRVTRTASHHDATLFDGTADGWPRYCVERLEFHPPGEFDWVPEPGPADS